MRRNFDYYLILVSLTLVSGSGKYLKNIRDDYCELYLNASEISEKSCHKNGTFVITNEYELTINSFTEILVWNWTKENIIEWNAVPITIKMEKLWWLKVFGIWSPEDYRLQPASFYLKKLNVTFANKFQINTKHFAITEKHTHYKKGPLNLRIEFKGSDYLEPINYVNASTKRIQEFGISEVHAPDSDLCDYFTFFSLPELQENVIKLHLLNVNMTVNMKCFKNYSKLMFIYLKGPYQSYENLTAIICHEWNQCHFTFGINGLRCPEVCECSYLYYFKVNCSARNKLTQIPPLPIPSDNKINLFFSQNQLSLLPSNTLPGYMAVVSLHVSGNQITSIAIDQLPRNLTYLDISDNPIKTIDSEVADFLIKINYVMQTDIRWLANCDEEHLFKFFQKIPAGQDIYFDRLNGTCPKKCMCCFDGTTNTFLINCTSKGVTYPELPTHIPNKVAMLLANCGIIKLPSTLFLLLKTQNVAHLDLRNNRLNSLDDKTVASLYEKSNTTIDLSGNPFDCYCKTKSFLGFLKDRKPSEYTAVLDRCKISMCPDNCVCCLDSLNSSGLNVDCRGRRLTEFPPLPGSVAKLDLGNNDITEINLQWQEFLKNKISSNELKIFLAGNPWICTCDNDIVAYTKSISQHIQDFAEMECSNLKNRLALVEDSEICPSYFIYPLILFVFSLIIITALNAFVYFKQPILMWFYEHEICMSMAVRVDLERMKKFDAFLCFTHKDEHLIEDYVEKLENGQRQFRLCFYLRDWNVGASIPECIIQSVKDSRRIIILMTKNFLESTWGKLEFRLALHATSKERCKRLIVILYPDVENFDDLDSELKAYMVLNTYLRRDSPNFWNKLIYSMPHVS